MIKSFVQKSLTFWMKPSLLADFLFMFGGWLIPTNQEPRMLSLKQSVAGLSVTSSVPAMISSARPKWRPTTKYFLLV